MHNIHLQVLGTGGTFDLRHLVRNNVTTCTLMDSELSNHVCLYPFVLNKYFVIVRYYSVNGTTKLKAVELDLTHTVLKASDKELAESFMNNGKVGHLNIDDFMRYFDYVMENCSRSYIQNFIDLLAVDRNSSLSLKYQVRQRLIEDDFDIADYFTLTYDATIGKYVVKWHPKVIQEDEIFVAPHIIFPCHDPQIIKVLGMKPFPRPEALIFSDKTSWLYTFYNLHRYLYDNDFITIHPPITERYHCSHTFHKYFTTEFPESVHVHSKYKSIMIYCSLVHGHYVGSKFHHNLLKIASVYTDKEQSTQEDDRSNKTLWANVSGPLKVRLLPEADFKNVQVWFEAEDGHPIIFPHYDPTVTDPHSRYLYDSNIKHVDPTIVSHLHLYFQ